MQNQILSLEIPKHTLSKIAALASRFDCPPEKVLLAGIINIVNENRNQNSVINPRLPMSRREREWHFRYLLETTDICKKIPGFVSEYIETYQENFTHSDQNNKDFWLVNSVKGKTMGRYKRDLDGYLTLSIPWGQFRNFLSNKGIDETSLRSWLQEIGSTFSDVKLAPGFDSPVIYCVCIPIIENLRGFINQ